MPINFIYMYNNSLIDFFLCSSRSPEAAWWIKVVVVN